MFKKGIVGVLSLIVVIIATLGTGSGLTGQDQAVIKLPPPQQEGGKPLMECLKLRQSQRDFSPDKLPPQVLSNLLWAAYGINRPDSGKRTVPSAVNWQNIDLYVATADGLFLYEAKDHALIQVLKEDIRGLTGTQDFVKIAPVNLVYVGDYARIPRGSDEDKRFYSAAHAAFISQNVYLFCASEGLATVVRALINREELAQAMKLRPEQKIMLAQTVGYPKK
ncbi:MAG: SagB/ThcOx family dehydrogenase [Candidatus Saccharicenans sp.]|jgi:nitroreductase|nr:SagB/ThcOx family dehydrogenase [Candidatus Saccharicenans sp.]MDH7494162.1 SagB/ThcOx family dehydrogenase [Candidatus Saccharicenans sp.]